MPLLLLIPISFLWTFSWYLVCVVVYYNSRQCKEYKSISNKKSVNTVDHAAFTLKVAPVLSLKNNSYKQTLSLLMNDTHDWIYGSTYYYTNDQLAFRLDPFRLPIGEVTPQFRTLPFKKFRRQQLAPTHDVR